MRKVSEIVKAQASKQFKQKKQAIIQKVLQQHKKNPNFQDILNTYMGVGYNVN